METTIDTAPSTIPDHVRKKPGPKPGFKKDAPKLQQHPILRIPDESLPLSTDSQSLVGFLHADRATWVERYREIPLPEVLFELGQLRKISEIAAEQANRRTTPDETKCWICSTPHPANSKWTMIYPDRDPLTGTTVNRFIDTISCANELQLRLSKAKLAAGQTPIKGLPDRGMVKGEGS